MTRFAVRTIGAFLKGLAYLAVGFLFGILPLLVVAAFKVAKGGVKVTMWTIGVIVLMLRSA